jgi:hypothetical protein
MGRTRRTTDPTAERWCCAYCDAGLRHELFRFSLTSPEGTWPVCPRCVGIVLERLQRAHVEAGIQLEEMWEASAEP